MKNNKLIIAAAGSGKTTFLINEAMKFRDERVLITTYTEANEEEIKKKFIKKYKSVPSFVKVQTWFSFLIQHGVKPYQGTFNEMLFKKEVKGMLLNDGKYGIKFTVKKFGKEINIPFREDGEFEQHYFTSSGKIYSDRLPKFVVKSNDASNGEVVKRISRIYQHIFIDEIQDLAGYDLEILKLLFQTPSNILLVGDPRQVTYLTHHENKFGKYQDGRIKEFIVDECKKNITYEIDETSLGISHRNNKAICDYSSKLHEPEQFSSIEPCTCKDCRNYIEEAEGIYLVREADLENYLERFNPIQLRWNNLQEVNPNYSVYNFGESKGKTFHRVIIYPTDKMEKWIYNNNTDLPFSTRAKFYVAITRAKYSVAIISNFADRIELDGVQLYYSN
ncbi:MAG: DNA helicase II [Bacteroidetes bacterium HGW-Bacteroidetes-17]|nr:MAG: DNA helicase II [Bacteroidetes bacterium HGW-Bacteroidetes-17]